MKSKFLLSLLSMLVITLVLFSCTEKENIYEASPKLEEPIRIDQNLELGAEKIDNPQTRRPALVTAAEWNDDPCDCNSIYDQYLGAQVYCTLFGGTYCDRAQTLWDAYNDCVAQNICPPGFTYDGANCSSGIHFPEGYSGFIFNNAFYVKQNCEISTANNCCPEGFTFDGANCYSGFHFPEGGQPFIFNNAFYIQPMCE